MDIACFGLKVISFVSSIVSLTMVVRYGDWTIRCILLHSYNKLCISHVYIYIEREIDINKLLLLCLKDIYIYIYILCVSVCLSTKINDLLKLLAPFQITDLNCFKSILFHLKLSLVLISSPQPLSLQSLT